MWGAVRSGGGSQRARCRAASAGPDIAVVKEHSKRFQSSVKYCSLFNCLPGAGAMLRWYSQWIASRLGWVTNIDHRTLAPIEFARSHLSGGTSCKLKREISLPWPDSLLILSPLVCLITVQGTSKGCRVFRLGMQAICLTFKVFCLRLLFLESWMMYCTWR